jgi:hypothetical protein
MARRQLRGESGQAFQITELVNEAVIRWLKGHQSTNSKLAWMAIMVIMAKVMRNVLVIVTLYLFGPSVSSVIIQP